jgi:O-methyltransferase
MFTDQLLDKFPIVSDQVSRPALRVVLGELEKTLDAKTPGDIVELGCYIGTTSLFIRRVLDAYGQPRVFHAYDSFAGLPDKSPQDSSAAGVDFVGGELNVSKKQFLEEFRRAGLRPPITHKAWFKDLTAADLPDTIAFAFLDGDFYESILTSLRLVWPRLSQDGIIAIDDYQRETLPGVDRAVRDFFQNKPISLRQEHNIAVIRKLSSNKS